MANELDGRDIVSFKELMMDQMIQLDDVAQLLIEKGIITEKEFFAKLKQVQGEYEGRTAENG